MHASTSVRVSPACATAPRRQRARSVPGKGHSVRMMNRRVSADSADADGRVGSSNSNEHTGTPSAVSGTPPKFTSTKTSRRFSLAGGFAGIATAVAATRACPATAGEVLEQLQGLLADAESAIERDPENDELVGQRTFFENQVERVQLNASFVDRLRPRVEKGETNYLQRLKFAVEDALFDDEIYFWKNAMGGRVTRTILDATGKEVTGVCLAFGQESLTADDGGKAAIELVKKGAAGVGGATDQPTQPNQSGRQPQPSLAYVSLSVRYGVRVSRIYEAGGELVYGFGYFDVRSPSGYAVRARVASRRDPVELVALNVVNVAESVKFYETQTDYGDCCPYIVQYTPNALRLATDLFLVQNQFGMTASAPLDLNGYAPKSPPGSRLMTFGEPKETVGILLQPCAAVEDNEAAVKAGAAFVGTHFIVGGDGEKLKLATMDTNGTAFANAGCSVSVEAYQSWETAVATGAQTLPFKYNEPPPV